MDANQVQQATEDLISDRNRLSTEAGGTGQSGPPATATKPSAANGYGNTQNTGGNGGQTAGAETK